MEKGGKGKGKEKERDKEKEKGGEDGGMPGRRGAFSM